MSWLAVAGPVRPPSRHLVAVAVRGAGGRGIGFGDILSDQPHPATINTGPYGRCVWRCDHDVVAHQVVALEFAGEATATFTMTGFTQGGGRRVRVPGTDGEIDSDEERVVVKTFADGNVDETPLHHEAGGHGGGDSRAIWARLEAVHQNDPGRVLTDAQESLPTHTIVFAAEKSRLEKRQVELTELFP